MGEEDGETAQSPGFLAVLVAGEKPWKTTDARAGREGSGGPGTSKSSSHCIVHMAESHLAQRGLFGRGTSMCKIDCSKNQVARLSTHVYIHM